ncbi:alpha,alpha-trehalase TreF [Shewanella sp.]|uniref:alpha,alpha-trehalase TreF n=1 Tax=Shewanella sp. TaxID=50422 RepID=UPI001EBAB743|nr:alpha,alpha-trehalase TreF [Shewanella sp.]NRB23332.1 alpha,alpha-trehalase TreF [Shewanella sp.]
MTNNDLFDKQAQESLHFFDSDLFKTVQMSGLFDDSKDFADAIPLIAYSDILQQYQIEKQNNSAFDVNNFVEQYFDIVAHQEIRAVSRKVCINDHIESLWELLKKPADVDISGSLLALKNPYIVPGGRFREVYYWDSFFTALGLVESGHLDLAESMLNNFLDLQSRYGCIPNGNRTYYLSRSQPPILCLLVELLLPFQKDEKEFIKNNMAGIEAEYNFWMKGKELLFEDKTEHSRVVKMPDGNFLNRYWDDNAVPRPESYREDILLYQESKPEDSTLFYLNIRAACESGWDFSSRWLGDDHSLASIRTTRILPIDLNCLLYKQEKILAQYHDILGDKETSLVYERYAAMRKSAIQGYMWSEGNGFYMDYDVDTKSNSSVKSLAGIFPLFVELADVKQAEQVSQVINKEFLKPGGLITTLIDTSQQWDSPNGWAPLHWFVVQGLLNYQQNTLATTVQQRWVDTVTEHFQQTGKIMEKYNVCQQRKEAKGGEYDVQDGFGWTNGVYLALRSQFKNSNYSPFPRV